MVVAATAQQPQAYVWVVDYDRTPDHWLPRACPRALASTIATTTPTDRELFLGASWRVHAIENACLAAMQSTMLYVYRFAARDFEPFGSPEPHAHVASLPVQPLGPPEPVGSVIEAHEAAGIELRILPNLWPYWKHVIAR